MDAYIIQTIAQADPNPGSAGNGDATPTPPVNGGATTIQPGGGTTPQTQSGIFGNNFYVVIIIMFLMMWVLFILPQRREKKKAAELLASLKKGDRVQTIGGIRGTIAELREGEVVLKVDETNNTRVTFVRSAIQGVIEGSKND